MMLLQESSPPHPMLTLWKQNAVKGKKSKENKVNCPPPPGTGRVGTGLNEPFFPEEKKLNNAAQKYAKNMCMQLQYSCKKLAELATASPSVNSSAMAEQILLRHHALLWIAAWACNNQYNSHSTCTLTSSHVEVGSRHPTSAPHPKLSVRFLAHTPL